MSQARLGYSPEGWRNQKNYPPRESTSMRCWAAEFLIRNACFQEALGALHALWPHRRGERYRRTAHEVADRFGLWSWAYIVFRGDELFMYPSFKVAPYHLRSGVRLQGAPGEWFLGRDDGWGSALVFDLRKPIAPQLRHAGMLLRGTRRAGADPRPQRHRHADYQAMLRVLDARTLNEKWGSLTPVICPNSGVDRAKKLHARAVALRDGGYLDLAFFSMGTVRTRA